jgi:serine/threonine protein kinase
MAYDPSMIEAVFAEAIQKPTIEERGQYLDLACSGDPELRSRIEALLAAHDRAGDFLHTVSHSTPFSVHERAGSVIGSYKLLQQIGEGGFGVVFMAEQERPLSRKVALKVIKLGMDTKQVIARFEAERQALAMMDHPNIAKVFDAGATESGRPYFVMELVRGVSITDYCDTNKLDTTSRLALFIPVCRAVQHAHQKGIIHRDIKPSNVLVTMHDGMAIPKVIDFGIAKATGGRLTEKTLFTEFHQLIGTPEYMSPEQAEMSGLDIDTRSDIYSLGVLLYELLTGTTPFDPKHLRSAAYAEIQRIIREVEPPRPSTRVSTLGDNLTDIAARRHTDPVKLGRMMRGELDWMVMKCLEKDRTRRYETAAALAADVQHYLQDEPVEASPPSATYKLRKIARKYRKTLRAALVVASLLVASTVYSGWQAARARRAEKIAVESRQLADQQREAAVAEKKRADEQAARVKAVNDFILNDVLAAAARRPGDDQPTLREALDEAMKQSPRGIANEPKLEAAIRGAIGRAYLDVEEYNSALPHLRKALDLARRSLGKEHPETLTIMENLALYYDLRAEPQEAQELYIEALAARREIAGDENPQTILTARSLAYLYYERKMPDKSRATVAELLRSPAAIADEHMPPNLKNAIAGLETRGNNDREVYDSAEDVRLMIDAAAMTFGDQHPQTLLLKQSLGDVLESKRNYAQAELTYREVLEARARRLGDRHYDTIITAAALAWVYRQQNRPDAMREITSRYLRSREALDDPRYLERKGEPRHLLQPIVPFGLGEFRNSANKDPAKWPLVYQAMRDIFGEEHEETIKAFEELADAYDRKGDEGALDRILDDALPRLPELMTSPRPTQDALAALCDTCGTIYYRRKLYAKAEPLLVTACQWWGTTREMPWSGDSWNLTREMPLGRDSFAKLISCYQRTGQAGKAAEWERKALAYWERVAASALELDASQTFIRKERAEINERMGRFADAIADYDFCAHNDSSTSATFWYRKGLVQLYSGDTAGYQETCREMLRRFSNNENATKTGKLCAIAPDGCASEAAPLVANDNVPGDNKMWFALTKGMIEYRLGNSENAMLWLERAKKEFDPKHAAADMVRATADFVIAMAQQRLQHFDEARSTLAAARRLQDKNVPNLQTHAELIGGPAGPEWLILQLVSREADAMFGRLPATPPATTQHGQ